MGSHFYTPDSGPHDPSSPTERRHHARFQLPTLAYVELDRSNGGIILNLSEGGLSVQAAISLMDDALPSVRFQLRPSKEWIETGARVVWSGANRKLLGLEFLDLQSEARLRLRNWIAGETATKEIPEELDLSRESAEKDRLPEHPHKSLHETASFLPAGEPAQGSRPDATSFREPIAADSDPLDDDEEEKFTWSPETGFIRVTQGSLRNKPLLPAGNSAAPHERSDDPSKPAERKNNLVWRPDTGFIHKWDDEIRHRSADAPPTDPLIPSRAEDPESIDLGDHAGAGWRPEPPTEPFPSPEVFRTRMHLVEKPGAAANPPDSNATRLRAHDLLEQHLREAKHSAENRRGEAPDRSESAHSHELLSPGYAAGGSEPRPKPQEFAFKSTSIRLPQPRNQPKAGNAFAHALPFVALAVPALLVGWLLGRSSVAHHSRAGNSPAAPSQMAAVETASPHASITAQVPDLEIVDANRQSRTIPFEPASTDPSQVSRQYESPTPPAETRSLRVPHEHQAPSSSSDSDENETTSATQDQEPLAVVSSTTHSLSSAQPQAQAEANDSTSPPSSEPEQILRQPQSSADGVQRGILIYRVQPTYPPQAERLGLEGDVKLHVTVGDDGSVRSVQLVSGPRILAEAAIDAVQRWRFSPTLVNGKPVEASGNVTLSFHLAYPHSDQGSSR